jgi:hypothetical protein
MNPKLDFTNPAHLKLALLSEGMRFDDSALKKVGSLQKEKIRSYNNSDYTDILTVPQEVHLGDGIIVGTHWRNESPWEFREENGKIILFYGNNSITEVGIFERPKYYDQEIADGIPARRVGVTLGKGAVSFFMRENCTYWNRGKPCKFCSLAPTQKTFNETENYKTPELVGKVIEKVLECGDELHHIQFSGGSDWNHDNEFKEYIEAVAVVSNVLGRRIDGNLITMPPRDLSLINEAYNKGMNHISFNLEVWDPKLFDYVCPGKAESYGREKIIEALEYAATVFKNGTYTTTVGGLESLETMFEGWEYLASKGVAPAFNIFHPNPKSVFRDKQAPSIDYLLEAARFQHEIYKAYGFEALLCKSCNRNALDNEAKEGYFS